MLKVGDRVTRTEEFKRCLSSQNNPNHRLDDVGVVKGFVPGYIVIDWEAKGLGNFNANSPHLLRILTLLTEEDVL